MQQARCSSCSTADLGTLPCTQFPWGRWMMHGAPLVIELSDVELIAASRPDSDWGEGPALAREWAAKQAELAGKCAARGTEPSLMNLYIRTIVEAHLPHGTPLPGRC